MAGGERGTDSMMLAGGVTEGGVQLVLVHGGVVCQWLASRGAFHLNGFWVSLNADVSYKFIHIFVKEFESEGGDMFDKVDESFNGNKYVRVGVTMFLFNLFSLSERKLILWL